MVADQFRSATNASGIFNNNNYSRQVVEDQDANLPRVFDGMFITVFFGLWIASIVGAFIIDAHPVLAFTIFFFAAVYIIVAAALGNTYQDASNSATFSAYSPQMPMAKFIFDNIVAAGVVITFSVFLALYAKQGSD